MDNYFAKTASKTLVEFYKNLMKILKTIFFTLCFILISHKLCLAITLIDMRGKEVNLPSFPKKIATIDDGFVEAVLTHIGHIDSVKIIGSWSMKRDYNYKFDFPDGKVTYQAWNTMKYLHPELDDLLCINSPQGNIINFEALAAATPDLVILRIGDCTVATKNGENIKKTIRTIEALDIPLLVLHAPKTSDLKKNFELALQSMQKEAVLIASLFEKQDEAKKLMQYIQKTEQMIFERTKNIPKDKRPSVLYFGLNPMVRKQGGAGSVHGINTVESYALENIINVHNAFRGKGRAVPISAEQIYALNPDVILLPTANGYHPARELLESSYYKNLQELRAVKEKKVYALPWTPMNCSRRLEYPLELLIMAKASYPELFKDINIYTFALEFYQTIYHVNEDKARALRSHQVLDWLKDWE